MISGVHVEVFLAASYAIFLVAVAFVLELVARHSHNRSEGYRNSGFAYLPKFDSWECPEGQLLMRAAVNYEQRMAVYRAPAHVCNCCRAKKNCTDSDEGRQLETRLDSWVESELRRFHRGISLVLLLLATVILVVETIRHAAPRELLIVGCLLLPVGIADTKLFASFVTRKGS
jgi:hypothetical protein